MLSTAFTLLTLALSVVGDHSAAQSRPRIVHQNVAKRAPGNVEIYKRYSSARWSFYDVGLGACGKTNVASDFIVALNSEQFGPGYPGAQCFKSITMTYKGKTATATIMDACPGCPYGGLDLSRGLFKYFASEDEGIISGDWSFNDGGSGAPAATTTKQVVAPVTTKTAQATPSTTWTPAAAPTTTKAAPTTNSTPKAVPTTTKTAALTSSSTPKAVPTTSSTPKAVPTPSSSSKVVPTTTPEVKANIAATTSSTPTTTEPATTSAAVSSKANYSSSFIAAKSSVASLASSFSSIRPSASASAVANTTALIEDNLQAISSLLANLGKLIIAAGLDEDSD